MLGLPKPMALKVPISETLFATAEYMVIIAPIIAPVENMAVRPVPSTRRKVDNALDCSA